MSTKKSPPIDQQGKSSAPSIQPTKVNIGSKPLAIVRSSKSKLDIDVLVNPASPKKYETLFHIPRYETAPKTAPLLKRSLSTSNIPATISTEMQSAHIPQRRHSEPNIREIKPVVPAVSRPVIKKGLAIVRSSTSQNTNPMAQNLVAKLAKTFEENSLKKKPESLRPSG